MKRSDCDRLFVAINAKSAQVDKQQVQQQAQQQATGASQDGAGRSNQKLALNRVEFMLALVHLACNKYIQAAGVQEMTRQLDPRFLYIDGVSSTAATNEARQRSPSCPQVDDVSEALHQLLAYDLAPRVSKLFGDIPKRAFRDRFCYTQTVDSALRAHESSVRVIFGAIAAGGRGQEAGLLLSLDEWLTFL